MKSITAQDWELLSFFEIEPELLDPDAPWVYNDALYNVICEQNLVSFAVQPSYRDVRLILIANGKTVYELSAKGIDDVKYRKENGQEILVICLDKGNSIFISLKPSFQIRQEWEQDIRDQ